MDVLKRRYDIVFSYFYTWSSFAIIIARLKGARAIMTGGADELDASFNRSWKKLFLHRWIFRLAHFFSSNILAVSTSDLKNFSQLVGRRKLSLIPHVVDTAKLTASLIQKQNTFLTIGWMGSEGNVRRKGMDIAVKLMHEFSARNWSAKLIIAGTPGRGTDALRKLVNELKVKDRVEFKFNISEEEKVHLLQSSNYYLQLSEFEGFGLAALEALSCGSCVVHTGRGGLSDFMGQYGLLQKWPVDVENVANEIIEYSVSAINYKNEIARRHEYVVQNFSLAMRREALCSIIEN
jgi:glycosyltransferase involved in cell wall biosynthesis